MLPVVSAWLNPRGCTGRITRKRGSRVKACEFGYLQAWPKKQPMGGWQRWLRPALAETTNGRARTPNDSDSVTILCTLRALRLDLDGEIVYDWRAGDVW